jgi:hypothetical protein
VIGADLDEAELFEIAMEAIRFRVQSDSGKRGEPGDEVRQTLGV